MYAKYKANNKDASGENGFIGDAHGWKVKCVFNFAFWIFLSSLTDWKHLLIFTIHTRAIAKISLLVLLQLQFTNQKIQVKNTAAFSCYNSCKAVKQMWGTCISSTSSINVTVTNGQGFQVYQRAQRQQQNRFHSVFGWRPTICAMPRFVRM